MYRLFVVDASAYLYSAYFAIRNMTNAKGESTNALFGFVRSILKLSKDFQPTHLVAVFDGPDNAKNRKELYPDYKANRQATPEDLRYQIERARQLCTFLGVPYLNLPGVEADDTMGTIAKWASAQGAEVYLCSGDKDLCQLVDDKVFILHTQKENRCIGSREVEELHGVPPSLVVDYLAIIGDASDNVPGLPGFGPKTAVKLLQQFGSLDALLDQADTISEPKKRETLLLKGGLARLSRQLVTIDCSLDIPRQEAFYQLSSPNIAALREFYAAMNFNSLLNELAPPLLTDPPECALNPMAENYQLISDEAALHKLMDHLNHQSSICFELQATSLCPMEAELVGIGFAIQAGEAWYLPLNFSNLPKEAVLEAVKCLFENPRIGFYGHHVKSACHILANAGIDVANLCFDTILASYLLNAQSRQHSLDALTLENFGKNKQAIKELMGKGKVALALGDVPIEKLFALCCESVDYTVRLKALFEPLLQERGLGKLFYELELPVLKVLAQMEARGVFLDLDCLKKLSIAVSAEIALCQSLIFELAGETFNLNSTKQLIPIFQKLGVQSKKKTPKGQMRLDSEVLEELKAAYPIAGKLLEYRSLEKLRSTYIDSLPGEINPKTGRIHCTFNQSVAATGRLSCQDPNLQNIPVRSRLGSEIRGAFRPENPNWSYLAADYSQIELRLLAHFSEDPNLMWAFEHGEDVHAHTASVIFNLPLAEVSKELRHQAKTVNFGIIYGQQAFGLSQELGIDLKAASQFIDMYFQRYSRVRDYLEENKQIARDTGKAVTLIGRERFIPDINSRNVPLRLAAERLAINTPLQGSAADLIKLAMLRCRDLFKSGELRGAMILQIHDELIFEIPDQSLSSAQELIRKAMEEVVELKVPLLVDISIGKNWKEC